MKTHTLTMKLISIFFMFSFLLVGGHSVLAADGANQISNGDFENGYTDMGFGTEYVHKADSGFYLADTGCYAITNVVGNGELSILNEKMRNDDFFHNPYGGSTNQNLFFCRQWKLHG